MNNRNEGGRRDYPSGQRQMQGSERDLQRSRGQYDFDDQLDRNRSQQAYGPNRNRGEYYGGSQFDERMQRAGWDEERNWEYEGGPERYSTSGYGETDQQGYRQNQRYARTPYGQSGQQRGFGQQRDFGQDTTGSDYYTGRQGYSSRGDFGSEYNTYGRNQGYGEGSGYTRSTSTQGQTGRQGYGTSSIHGGESSGLGGRGSLYGSRDYQDEGEMSGYGGRELSSQQYGSSSTGRYGTAPGQYGYGGYGATGRGYRGIGPKNYTRSDERLTEEINERLTDDDDLDATEITVRVANGKVTLEGNVDQRWMKHRAEDIADACIGVKEVDNRILVTTLGSNLEQGTSATRGTTSRTSQSQTGSSASGSGSGSSGSTTPH